jgi:hypothetical protein
LKFKISGRPEGGPYEIKSNYKFRGPEGGTYEFNVKGTQAEACATLTVTPGRDIFKSPQGCSGTRPVGKDETSPPAVRALYLRDPTPLCFCYEYKNKGVTGALYAKNINLKDLVMQVVAGTRGPRVPFNPQGLSSLDCPVNARDK